MEFFRFTNPAHMVLAWIIVGAIAWALLPVIQKLQKLLELVRLIHGTFQ